jgi:exonuclease III
MRILSWNCQGSGNPKTVRAIKKLISTQKPDIIFLMETKQLSSKPCFLNSLMDKYSAKIVDCSTAGGGRAGGLVLLWNNCNLI